MEMFQMAQYDGVNRNNDALIPSCRHLVYAFHLSFRCKFLWDLRQMSLTFHVNIFESFSPDEKLSIPELQSLKNFINHAVQTLLSSIEN